MQAENSGAFERILAIRMDNIGDVVMLTPALKSVRAAYPDARISLLASPAGSQVAPLIPTLDDVIPWKPSWQDISGKFPQDPGYEMELIRLIEDGHYDLALIFTSFSQSPYPPAYVCYLAGVPIRAGQSKEFGGALLTHWGTPPGDDAHQVNRNLALLKLVDIPSLGIHLDLDIPEDIRVRVVRILQENGVPEADSYLVVAPGASCSARRYPLDRMKKVVERVADEFDIPVVLVGSEKERKQLETILAIKHEKVINLVGRTSVPEFAGLIAGSSGVIANNSSALHLADAFHIPMVILYSGTELITQWEPRNTLSILLNEAVSCSPCYRFECPYRLECLDISPETVLQACHRLFAISAQIADKPSFSKRTFEKEAK